MPYSSVDSEHVALIDELEFRIDLVAASGQTPAVDRTKAYLELERAGNELLMNAPLSILNRDISEISATVNPNVVLNDITTPITDSVSLKIPLPLTFLRFVSIDLKGWVGHPDGLETVNSQVYRTQLNPLSRNNIYNPVCALVPHFVASTHDQALECFPQDATANPVNTLYCALEKDPEDFSEILRDPLLWLGAARILRTHQDQDGYALAQQNYDNLIEKLNAGVLNKE